MARFTNYHFERVLEMSKILLALKKAEVALKNSKPVSENPEARRRHRGGVILAVEEAIADILEPSEEEES